MALLDRNGVYGSARFHTSAKRKRNSRSCRRGGCRIELRSAADASGMAAASASLQNPPRLPLLCEIARWATRISASSLRTSRCARQRRAKARPTFDDLKQYAAGLVCLTGGDEGPLAAALMRGGEAAGRETVEQLVRIFGQRECLCRSAAPSGTRRRSGAIRLRSASHGHCTCRSSRPTAFAMPPRYDREILDLFTAIRHHTELDHAGRLLALNSQRHLRPARRDDSALPRCCRKRSRTLCELSSRLQFRARAILATSFLAIRSPTAKRWTAFCASASPKA